MVYFHMRGLTPFPSLLLLCFIIITVTTTRNVTLIPSCHVNRIHGEAVVVPFHFYPPTRNASTYRNSKEQAAKKFY